MIEEMITNDLNKIRMEVFCAGGRSSYLGVRGKKRRLSWGVSDLNCDYDRTTGSKAVSSRAMSRKAT